MSLLSVDALCMGLNRPQSTQMTKPANIAEKGPLQQQKESNKSKNKQIRIRVAHNIYLTIFKRQFVF